MQDCDVFEFHEAKTGKISISPTVEVKDRETLSCVYTPGVAKVCEAIARDDALARKYTIAGKMVAVVSDGSAVLGLGNIGARAALPVMEGKCVIFKEFANVEAFPICLDEHDPDRLVEMIKALSVNFAAINLEDIAAPKCFSIEQKLQELLDIPVMHDDQHGTAIVVLAAVMGALKLTGKKNVRVVLVGSVAAGTAVSKFLLTQKEG